MFLKELVLACLIVFGGFMVYAYSMISTSIIDGATYYIIHGRDQCVLCFPSGLRTSREATLCDDYNTIKHQDDFVIRYYNKKGEILKVVSHENLKKLSKKELHEYAKSRFPSSTSDDPQLTTNHHEYTSLDPLLNINQGDEDGIDCDECTLF